MNIIIDPKHLMMSSGVPCATGIWSSLPACMR